MIARGTAALFAHLVHYRHFRFLWAISLTAEKYGMVCRDEESCGCLLPSTLLDAELLITLLLPFLSGAGLEMHKFSALSTLRGCLQHLNHGRWDWEDSPKTLLPLGFALPPGLSQMRVHLSPCFPLCAPQMHELLQPHHLQLLEKWVSAAIPSQFWVTVKLIYRLGLICITPTLLKPKIQGLS